MKILGYEIKPITNTVIPPKEVQTSEFSYVVTPTEIVAAEITEYKKAVISAKSSYTQQRTKLYDIYQNALDFDGHLKGLIEKRLLNTSGRKLAYVMNEEPSDLAGSIIDSPAFAKLVNDIILVKFWGMGLFEFDKVTYNKKDYMNYTLIPIKHVDPFEKKVRKTQAGASKDDVSFEGKTNVIFLGSGTEFGLFQQLGLLAIYKRAAIGDWAQYSQLAGTNFRTIKYRGAMPDPNTRAKIRDIVNNAGSGTHDLPADIDVETSNQTSSSQNQLFENYVQYLDDEMTKLVLGQTMTTEDGSSKSQAEVHERTQDDIFDSDAKFVLDVFNYELYEIMLMYGLPQGGRWEFVESATAKEIEDLERDIKLNELIKISPQHLYEKYDVPAPAEQTTGNLASILGVGGLQSLQAIVTDSVLTLEQKVNTLVVVFGLDEESARKIATP